MGVLTRKKTAIVLVLIILLLISSILATSFLVPKQQVSASFFDTVVNSSKLAFVEKLSAPLSAASLVFSAGGNIARGVKAAKGLDAGKGFCAFFEGVVGTDGGEHKEIMDKLNAMDKKLDALDGKIDDINNSIMAIDNKIDDITKVLDDVHSMIPKGIETIVMKLNETELSMRNWNEQHTKINNFYSAYANARGTLENKIALISKGYDDHKAFLSVVANQPNGEAMTAAAEKIGFNINKSYTSLTADERAYVDAPIEYNGETTSIKAEFEQYNELMYSMLNELFVNFKGNYETNMYDAFINMSKYILGEISYLGAGIGETFYKLAVLSLSNSDDVHNKYKEFMASVSYDFLMTGYLCNLALNTKYQYESANGDQKDKLKWDAYKEQSNNIQAKVEEVMAYMDYEYRSCVDKYDVDGSYIAPGTSLDDYIIYYGNPKNKEELAIEKNTFMLRKNCKTGEMQINSPYLFLASNESYQLKLYYNYREIQDDFTWATSDSTVAIVDNGRVMAVSPGRCAIGIELNDKFYKLSDVCISSAYAIKNDVGKDRFVFSDNNVKYMTRGKGYDYVYNTTLAPKVEPIRVASRNVDMQELFNVLDEDMPNFTFGYDNPNYTLEGKMVYFAKDESGVLSATTNIAGNRVVIQQPVLSHRAKVDKASIGFSDSSFKPGSGVKYIYTLDDLLKWQKDYAKGVQRNLDSTNPEKYKPYGQNVVLMNDIDYEWNTWNKFSLCFGYRFPVDSREYTMYTIDGNGHTIKNITLENGDGKGYAMFDDVAGTIKGLTIENVQFKENNPQQKGVKVNYSVIGRQVNDVTERGTHAGKDALLHPAHIDDIHLTGNIVINAGENINEINFTPLVFKPRTPDNIEWTHQSTSSHHRFTNTANVIIDCAGRDVGVNINFYGDGFNLDGNDNILAGRVTVQNIKNNDRVKMNFDKANVIYDFKAESIDNYKYVKDFTPKDRMKIDKTNNKTFWTNIGYTDKHYDLSQLSGTDAIPRYRVHEYMVDGTAYELYAINNGFRDTYIVGETPNTGALAIFANGTDVTKQCAFNSIDTTTAGAKNIICTYDGKSLTIPVNYVVKPLRKTLTYTAGEHGTGDDVVKYVGDGVKFQMAGNSMFTRVGYEIVGWQEVTPDNTAKYKINEAVTFNEDHVVEPIWKAMGVNAVAKIYYEQPDGSYKFINEYTLTKFADSTYVPDVRETAGRTLVEESFHVSPDGTSVFEHHYNLPRYNITFVYDDTKCQIEGDEYTKTLVYREGQQIETNPLGATLVGHWAFDGNVEGITEATDNATITIKYKSYDYTVRFMYDGEVYREMTDLGMGDTITINDPLEVNDGTYRYIFKGWDGGFNNVVTGDKTYNAVLDKVFVEYAVTVPQNVIVKNADGEEISTGDTLHKGDEITIDYRSIDGKRMDTMDIDGAMRIEDNRYEVIGELVITCTDIEPPKPDDPKPSEEEEVDVDIDDESEVVKVTIDGKELDEGSYTIDGTKVVINKDYLDTLAKGSHELVVITKDGEVKSVFDIVDNGTPAWVIAVSVVGSLAGVAVIGGAVALLLKRRKTIAK